MTWCYESHPPAGPAGVHQSRPQSRPLQEAVADLQSNESTARANRQRRVARRRGPGHVMHMPLERSSSPPRADVPKVPNPTSPCPNPRNLLASNPRTPRQQKSLSSFWWLYRLGFCRAGPTWQAVYPQPSTDKKSSPYHQRLRLSQRSTSTANATMGLWGNGPNILESKT